MVGWKPSVSDVTHEPACEDGRMGGLEERIRTGKYSLGIIISRKY